MRRRAAAVIFFILLSGAALAIYSTPLLHHPLVLLRLARADAPQRLPVPLAGVAPRQLVDSWGSPRSGGRKHQGIDIFAPRGREVVSATDGIVITVGESRLGGHIVRVLGPGLEWHYYAHLDRFAAVRPGDAVVAGTVLGYVGDSGNARGTPCHLHYGIYSRAGRAKDPYAELTAVRKSS